jgi:hypothetical protein
MSTASSATEGAAHNLNSKIAVGTLIQIKAQCPF